MEITWQGYSDLGQRRGRGRLEHGSCKQARPKGEGMRRRLLLVGLLVVSVAMLSGCDLIDQIIDAITGGGTPGGGGTGGVPISGRMEFHLSATIQSDDGTSMVAPVGTIFYSGAGNYNATTRTFTATWDGGDFSNTRFEAKVNPTGEYLESFYARQTRSGLWGAWTYVHEIRGYDVLYSHTDGTSKYFVVDGPAAHVTIDIFSYKTWSISLGSAQNPVDWVSGPGAIISSPDNIITIRLDY